MSCDLERIYGSLAAQLPDAPGDGERFHLDEAVITLPPPELASNKLLIQKSFIQRLPGCRGDYINIVVPRPTVRQLGLLVLAVLFHEERHRTILHVTNPASQVKHVVLEYRHYSKKELSGFRSRPWVLGYVPEEAGATLLTKEEGFSAPLLRLTNLQDCQKDEQDWQTRDTLYGIGGTIATAEVAEYLLNAGRKSEKLGNFMIPANKDFFSAEINLWTPEAWAQFHRNLDEWSKNRQKPAKQ